ncbi:RagB/SusD family nutrient uptake outer membrane protein [Bacteroides zoogleoformans]|uniref:RagB/SusD family nutrient uptake outer membrane protein n=1 Tax=Bacteroides zoogleoformans TaxID=28119 RepID=UPI00248E6054|nr:RagB/SusD family nutrient uptake outer membrane protein [Bacteroides zoogleoformans]
MKITRYIVVGLLAIVGFGSCSESFLDTEYTAELDAQAASEAAGNNPDVFLNGMWSWMVTFNMAGTGAHDDFGIMSILHSTDMMGQDIALSAGHWFRFDYQHDNRMYNYRRTSVDWLCLYTLVAKANEVISLYPNGGETAAQKSLLGQAKAIRGMAYYYLIQLYQFPVDANGAVNNTAKGVPLIYTTADGKTEEEITASKGRNTLGAVYEQIEKDLTAAVENLAGYERPNKNYIDVNVANGLLARYYLLSQQWQKAAEAANKARDGYAIMGKTGLHDGFMDISNEEWMWGFDHTTETTTTYASFFSHISALAPGYGGLGYSTRLIDKKLYESIASDDYRKSLFNGAEGNAKNPTVGSRKPYANLKFGTDGTWTMDYMYMRAAEMVLIEAEAYAHLNQGAKAAEVLKILMANRQPSWDMSTVTVEDVYLQRRIELWGEGFSYFDLKRLNKGIDRNYEGNNHLAGYKLTVPAQEKNWVYQIPLREMQENKLITEKDQNE